MSKEKINWTDGILEGNSVGYDLRHDGQYQTMYRRIKDLRREARSLEKKRQLNEPVEHPKRIWREVYQACNEVLTSISKDYEIIAWMIEASVHVNGFKGLATVLVAAWECIGQFGLEMHPTLDDEEERHWKVHALSGLNGELTDGSLVHALYQVPIIASGEVLFWELQQYLSDKASDHIDPSKIEACVSTMTPDEMKQLHLDVEQCLQAFDVLMGTLDGLYADDSPASTRIKQSLSNVLDCVRQLMDSRGVLVSIASNSCLVAKDDKNENQDLNVSNEVLQTRTQALARLKSVAQYFSDHEPHSPVPYMLERTIAWANMRLPELLAEMINNSQELSQVYTLTGIQSNNPTN